MNLFMKQNHRHREHTGGCQEKEGCGRDRVGFWGLSNIPQETKAKYQLFGL